MLVIFNSAYITEDFETEDDRKTIAVNYLSSWFIIDLLAILPLQEMTSSSEFKVSNVLRVLRLGRLSKILKLMKLMRTLRFLKNDG